MKRLITNLAIATVVLAPIVGGGLWIARATSDIATSPPTSVLGPASPAHPRADDGVIEVRDGAGDGVVEYSFLVKNGGHVPLTITGLDATTAPTPPFRLLGLTDAMGYEQVRLGAGDSAPITLRLDVADCASAKPGAESTVSEIKVSTVNVGVFKRTLSIDLPDELRTHAPSRAECRAQQPRPPS